MREIPVKHNREIYTLEMSVCVLRTNKELKEKNRFLPSKQKENNKILVLKYNETDNEPSKFHDRH